MPVQERIGLDNEQCLFPPPHATCQHEQPEAVTTIQVGSFHVAVQNARLMTKQGILDKEFCFGVGEVDQSTAHDGSEVWTKQFAEGWLQPTGERMKELEKKANPRSS